MTNDKHLTVVDVVVNSIVVVVGSAVVVVSSAVVVVVSAVVVAGSAVVVVGSAVVVVASLVQNSTPSPEYPSLHSHVAPSDGASSSKHLALTAHSVVGHAS